MGPPPPPEPPFPAEDEVYEHPLPPPIAVMLYPVFVLKENELGFPGLPLFVGVFIATPPLPIVIETELLELIVIVLCKTPPPAWSLCYQLKILDVAPTDPLASVAPTYPLAEAWKDRFQ